MARLESIRILMSIACIMNFKLYQIDVKCAFLNGYLNEEVFVEQPKGFEDPHFLDHVPRLKKALYGLKQAPIAWYDQFIQYLLDRGFKKKYADQTIEFSEEMKKEFEMSIVRELTFFLGLQVKQRKEGIFIS